MQAAGRVDLDSRGTSDSPSDGGVQLLLKDGGPYSGLRWAAGGGLSSVGEDGELRMSFSIFFSFSLAFSDGLGRSVFFSLEMGQKRDLKSLSFSCFKKFSCDL